MSKTASLMPPLGMFDYPVKLMIRIFPDGAMELYPEDMPPLSAPTAISRNDLANISQQLQDAMSSLAMTNITAAEYSSDEMDRELRFFAELSSYAYRLIFKKDGEADYIIKALPPGSSIEIVSEDFILPWQLLYSADISEPISCTNFFGLKYIIFNTLIGSNSRLGPQVSPNIATQHLPYVGLLANMNLPAVANREIPYFENLHKKGAIHLIKLRELDPQVRENELKTFCNFWQEASYHIAHFACHARYNQQGPNLSEITLSNEFSITLQDMVIRQLQITSNPLIIMNACQTNNQNPLYSSHFATQFLQQGARGVVTTECYVPDVFAAEFSQEVYERLLDGKTIGESLLGSRQYFWEEHNNPSGLLYTMYGPSAIRLT